MPRVRQIGSLMIEIGLRLVLIVGLLGLAGMDLASYREQTRGRESGLAQDQPVLEAPRAGINVALEQYETNIELLDALSQVRQLGYGTVVQHLSWADIEPEEGEFKWERWDYILDLVHEQGLQVIAVLDGAPAWARADSEAEYPHAPPQDPATYAGFAAAVAARYAGLIRAYQIWDTPNIYPYWGKGTVNPAEYLVLLAAASSAIRANDPDALVIAGGMAPNTEASGRNMSDIRFLKEIYRLGAAQWFDVLGVKAYGFWTGPYDRRVSEDTLNFSRVILLREEMVRRGDSAKPVWALDGGWAALDADWSGDPSPLGSDQPMLQADRLQDAFTRVQREWPWMTLFCALHLQPAAEATDPIWGLSLLDSSGIGRPLMVSLGALQESTGLYMPGLHEVTAQSLSGRANGEGERAVTISYYGTDLDIEVVTLEGGGTLRMLSPRERTFSLDGAAGVITRLQLDRGEQPGEHTVYLVGSADQISAIRSIQGGSRPDRNTIWAKVIMALLLTIWCVGGIVEQLSLVDWRRPFRWAQRLARRWDLVPVAALALLFALAMAAPGSMVRLGLLALYGLGVLLRPDAALVVAVATIPLAPVHVGLGPGSFSVTELSVLCAVLARIGATVLGGQRLWSVRWRSLRWTDGLLLLFVVWVTIGALRAEYQREALRELRTAIIEPALLYVLLRMVGSDTGAWRRLVNTFYASAVGTALYSLAVYPTARGVIAADGVRRARAFFGSPNNLALYLERLFPLGLSLAGEPGRRRYVYGAGAALILVTVLLTFSRGAWLLGLPAALLVLALLRGKRARRYVLVALILLAIAAIPILRTERFSSLLNLRGGTTLLRLQLWQSSWAMIQDHVWTGVGLDNFLYYYGDYILPGAEIERWLSHPHNFVLDLWVRTGLPGLILFLSAMGAAIGPILRRWRSLAPETRAIAAGLLAGLGAMFAHGLIDNAIFVPELAYYTVFALAYLLCFLPV